jgi:hypothetical protein
VVKKIKYYGRQVFRIERYYSKELQPLILERWEKQLEQYLTQTDELCGDDATL